MAGIVSSGIGSGIDVQGLVQQLVTAEGAPAAQRLDRQEAQAQAKLSAFGSLKSALSLFQTNLEKMQDIDSLLTRSATSGNEELFTLSADETALPASYSIEVRQLAQAQKLTSSAFVDADSAVGTGTLTIAVGGESFAVEIADDDNNSLAGIRDTINASVDNTGVSATIVNGDAGSFLILSGEKTGVDQTITVTSSGGDGGLSALEYDPANSITNLTEAIAAQDAHAKIDGFDVYSTTNTIAGAVGGVTVNLLGAAPDETFSLLVQNDQEAVRATIDEFVTSYNSLMTTLDSLSNYDAESDSAAPLVGDSTMRGIRDQIRRELSVSVTDINAPFSTLSEIGIGVDVEGKLQTDNEVLNDQLGGEFSKLGQLFAASDGYAVRLNAVVENYLGSGGILENRTDGLDATIEDIGERRESLDERLVAVEARLLKQFNALDSLIGQLANTSSFLTLQLANLPTLANSNK